MASCVWAGAAAAAHAPYNQVDNGSCMMPQSTIPNFMGVPTHPHHAQLQTQLANQCQQQQQQHAHAHHMTHTMNAAITAHAPQTAMEVFPETERRSSSIAALRLKAREHSAAMGILSVYGK